MNRELRVHDADDAQRPRHGRHLFLKRLFLLCRQRERRQAATGIAGVDPGLFDVLHDTADDHLLAVADRVDIHLHGEIQKSVQQDRTLVGHADGFGHVVAEIVFLMDDLHGPAAKHIGWSDHQRIPHVRGHLHGLFRGPGGAVGRLLQAQTLDQLLESLPVLRQIDGIRCRADNRHACRLQGPGQLQRRLPAVLDDHAPRLLLVDDLQDVFQRQRFEVEPIRGVEIRRYRLGIAIHHDGLEAGLLQGKGGMDAAIVEFDPLADPVRPPAEDHDLFRPGGLGLAFALVG